MRERFGLPDITGHRRFVTAVGVDALGSGIFMPVAVLYFLNTTTLTLPEVGLVLSFAGAAGFPVILYVGGLVDRLGAKRVLLAANALQAAAYLGYPLARSFGAVLAVTAMAAVGQVSFWAAYSPLVAAISRPGEREMWVGFLGALRNLGFAVGGLASGVAVTIGTLAAYHAVAIANALSYLLALVLLAGVAAPVPVVRTAGRAHAQGWGVVLRDRPYHLLVLTNVGYALCGMALNFAMAVYAVEVLGLPGWVGGGLFVLNTVMVAFGQGLVVRGMTGHRRHHVAMLGNTVYAASFLIFAAVGLLDPGPAVVGVFVAAAVYTMGELLGGPVLSAAALEAAPSHLRGRYFSLYQMSWNVSGIVAPALFAALLAAGRYLVWFALTGIALVAVGMAHVSGRALPSAAQRVTNAAHDEVPDTGSEPHAEATPYPVAD